jgi:hypothetical protein
MVPRELTSRPRNQGPEHMLRCLNHVAAFHIRRGDHAAAMAVLRTAEPYRNLSTDATSVRCGGCRGP